MFNSEFYPTPKKIVKKMLAPYIKYGRSGKYGSYLQENLVIFEPSAGKGDILDVVAEYKNTETTVYCMEKDPNLQYILQEKGYRLLGGDFLQYTGDYSFDLIVMNPPFSNGDEHLLKAWEILDEGDIVCLLNSETINNPYTASRAYLKGIIQAHGSAEDLGPVFTDGERKTAVNVSLVRLKKVAKKAKFNFEFKNVTKEGACNITEETLKNAIATQDVIGNMIIQHGQLKEQYVKFMEALAGLQFYSQSLLPADMDIYGLAKQAYNGNHRTSYNAFNDIIKFEMWTKVLNAADLDKHMTHAVRDKFNEQRKRQGCLDFTKENIADFIEMIFMNRGSILDQAVGDVFDLFTKYHEENRCPLGHWKTNNKYKVNRKIILPRWVEWGTYSSQSYLNQYGANFYVNSSYYSKYTDIDKVMCYLTGKHYKNVEKDGEVIAKGIKTIYDALKEKFEKLGTVKGGAFDGTCQSEFFNLRFFKKGTLHIEFKDKKLWELFNLAACAGKNWLPEEELKKYRKQRQAKQPKQETKELLALTA